MQEKEDSMLKGINLLKFFIPLILGAFILILNVQVNIQKASSIYLLIISFVLILLSIILEYTSKISRYNSEKTKIKKQKNISITIYILLSFAVIFIVIFIFSGNEHYKNSEYLEFYDNNNLSGTISVVAWDNYKGNNRIMKNYDKELSLCVFKLDSSKSVYWKEDFDFDSSGVTNISSVPKGIYNIGISFFGIILDFIPNVQIEQNRYSFLDIILKNYNGKLQFQVLDSLNNPMKNKKVVLVSSAGIALRGTTTDDLGISDYQYIRSINKNSVGNYFAEVYSVDSNNNSILLFKSQPLTPYFSRPNETGEIIKLVIKQEKNL